MLINICQDYQISIVTQIVSGRELLSPFWEITSYQEFKSLIYFSHFYKHF